MNIGFLMEVDLRTNSDLTLFICTVRREYISHKAISPKAHNHSSFIGFNRLQKGGLFAPTLGYDHEGLGLHRRWISPSLTPTLHRLLEGEILPSTTPINNFSTNWVNDSAHKKFKENSNSE